MSELAVMDKIILDINRWHGPLKLSELVRRTETWYLEKDIRLAIWNLIEAGILEVVEGKVRIPESEMCKNCQNSLGFQGTLKYIVNEKFEPQQVCFHPNEYEKDDGFIYSMEDGEDLGVYVLEYLHNTQREAAIECNALLAEQINKLKCTVRRNNERIR